MPCKDPEKARNKKYYQEHKEYFKKYYQKHKEHILATIKKHRIEHPEEYKVRYKKYLQNHPDCNKKYRRNHIEKLKYQSRKYRQDHPEKFREKRRKQRARKLNAPGSHTAEDIKFLRNISGGFCSGYNRDPHQVGKEKLTVDHIKPLSKGGSDYTKNIQMLCQSCNSTKGIKYN